MITMTREQICKRIASLTSTAESVYFMNYNLVELPTPTGQLQIYQNSYISGTGPVVNYDVICPDRTKGVIINGNMNIAFTIHNNTLELPGGIVSDVNATKSKREKAFDSIKASLISMNIELTRLRVATDLPFNFSKNGISNYYFFWGITDSEDESCVIWIPKTFVTKELRRFHDKGQFFGCGLDTASYFALLDYFINN